MPFRTPLLLGFGCPDGVWVGWGVSEVRAAFVTTLACPSDLVRIGSSPPARPQAGLALALTFPFIPTYHVYAVSTPSQTVGHMVSHYRILSKIGLDVCAVRGLQGSDW
jgi:hypothetical protein